VVVAGFKIKMSIQMTNEKLKKIDLVLIVVFIISIILGFISGCLQKELSDCYLKSEQSNSQNSSLMLRISVLEKEIESLRNKLKLAEERALELQEEVVEERIIEPDEDLVVDDVEIVEPKKDRLHNKLFRFVTRRKKKGD
jgi:hypothetical protein